MHSTGVWRMHTSPSTTMIDHSSPRPTAIIYHPSNHMLTDMLQVRPLQRPVNVPFSGISPAEAGSPSAVPAFCAALTLPRQRPRSITYTPFLITVTVANLPIRSDQNSKSNANQNQNHNHLGRSRAEQPSVLERLLAAAAAAMLAWCRRC